MVFSSEDKIFIKNLVLLKDYTSRSHRRVGIKMTSMYCCERFEKRPVWIVSPAADDHFRCARQRTLMLRGTWGEGQWQILQECPVVGEDVASNLGDVKRLLYLPAGQRPTAHRAKGTIALLRRETPSFIGPELWPANSPDLNSVDYMQNLRSNTGTRLPGSNTEHRRVEGAPHRCVGRVEADCH